MKFSLQYLVSIVLLGFVMQAMVPGPHETFVRAQGAEPGEGDLVGLDKDYMREELESRLNISDYDCPDELYNRTTPLIQLTSITPTQGPITGETRVEVRGCPFSMWEHKYHHPKCKFGDVVVPGSFVSVAETARDVYSREARHKERTHKGIQCENAPPVEVPTTVDFCVSLTGLFNDSMNCMKYTYYPATRIYAFNPRYGPKDGETTVKVWGDNFFDFPGTQPRCGFGTKAVPAKIYNATYLECESPTSDVVEKPIPFTISLNNQQNSKDTLWYYYYNWPQVEELVPNRGPESGGTHILVKGKSFFPFRDQLDQIDNLNETFCGFMNLTDTKNNKGIKVPAVVHSSTSVTCIAPESLYYHKSDVEITLNDQQYTDDAVKFYWYKPPNLFSGSPLEGPVTGGTEVTLTGTNFENTTTLQCKFGDVVVPGHYISESEMTCIAPPSPDSTPGTVPLTMSNRDDMWSTPLQYLYYDIPVVDHIDPLCGPESGFTQIAIHGKGFADLGRNKALCVFNSSIYTNATVMSPNLIYCDSPPLQNEQGYSWLNSNDHMVGNSGGDNEHEKNFYFVQLTIDGGRNVTALDKVFNYYHQVEVRDVTPDHGPISGKTDITVNVTGLQQPGICGVVVRLGTYDYTPRITGPDTLQITNIPVDYPGLDSVQVTYNHQQFSPEKVVHSAVRKQVFKYYQDPLITYHQPTLGPSIGGTKIKVNGLGFQLFPMSEAEKKHLHEKKKREDGRKHIDEFEETDVVQNELWVRYVSLDGHVLAGPFLVPDENYNNDVVDLVSPPQPPGQRGLIEFSLNKQNWIVVKSPLMDHSFLWYDSPHVTSIFPTFGPVKNTRNLTMTIHGTNFKCPNEDCTHIKVRFGRPPGNAIYVKGELVEQGTIECQVPKYAKPDVMEVEVSFNGLDYTNDNMTFGYYDPYVIDVEPRLLATDGTTDITVKGLGFVNSGETKVKYQNLLDPFKCDGSEENCIHEAPFIDKNHLWAHTLPQRTIIYNRTNTQLQWEAFNVEVSVYSDLFTDNKIELYYFDEPTYGEFVGETPANIQDELFLNITINPRDMWKVRKYAKPKCRFHSEEKNITLTVNGLMLHQPLNIAFDGSDTLEPNTLKCKTPIWPLDPEAKFETVKLDVSINGYNFGGGFNYTFTEPLILHRTVPMAGPYTGNNATVLIGQGFRPRDPKKIFSDKWGPLLTQVMDKDAVSDYMWTARGFENFIEGAGELKAYIYEAIAFQRIDTRMYETITYSQITKPAAQTFDEYPKGRRSLSDIKYKVAETGGPWYVEVGIDKKIPLSNTIGYRANETEVTDYVYYDYQASYVEFYEYKQPTIVKKRPQNGVTQGGTKVEVQGYDFRYYAEYGVVPHCKFGDKIVRAVYDSTVRIVCFAPPSENINQNVTFEVSLNGVDWTESGQKFSYYVEPEMYSAKPDSGPAGGGTEIFIRGKNFPRMQGGDSFNCKFSPTNVRAPPKIMPATWLNDTTIKCITPGGWSKGDQMKLQVTFNGMDYDNNGFTFILYKIDTAFPRSGPSDGTGGDILISGAGFRADTNPKCMLNGTIYNPVGISWNQIRCPMPRAAEGDSYYGNVDLKVAANGATWTDFIGGFTYYPQPTVLDIYPKNGPAQGIGIINFYGRGFRADFPNAKLGCKIGNSVGEAVYISDTQLRCVVEDIETVPEGEKLPAQAALNSYSWSALNDDLGDTGYTYFVPYTVTSISPASGPSQGGTDVIVQGRGFIEGATDQPRCRFGTPANYIIVDADILSYNRLACVTPEGLHPMAPAKFPSDIPFSIALTSDAFDPWTETSHKFRLYQQPRFDTVVPTSVNVGEITEVVVTIEQNPDLPEDHENIFFEPLPSNMQSHVAKEGEEESNEPSLAHFSQIKCTFGRFGETAAVFIDEYHLKCTTPSVPDDPADIYMEEIEFSITMNGFDYDINPENKRIFTFVGTGTPTGLLPIVILILLSGLLIAACAVAAQKWFEANSQNNN